jgi:2,4-dienoyl-CoA reductase (NADPH2)
MTVEAEGSRLYPHLLAPIRVAHKTLRNRIIMGSMHTRLESAPDHTRKVARFYADRARGEAGLIVTGGISPNPEGLVEGDAGIMTERAHIADHVPVVDAVHEAGGVICMQILHAGRYAKVRDAVAPSAIRAPINANTPRALTGPEIERTIADFANCAALAKEAGYDGVEVMGSEGYLLNQFAVPRTNRRDDEWGGSADNRQRLPVEVVERVRKAVGPDFIIVYRISSIDLVEGGAPADEIVALAKKIEAAGADILNTGIGWHEARVPTIAYMVPRAAWRSAPARLKKVVSIPVVVSNRINMPEVAEEVLASGCGDMVSLARPMLADAEFARKARLGKAHLINACIACNQACLDYIFSKRVATCLVNPRACRETEFEGKPAAKRKKIAVIGGGAAGMSCASEAAARGHEVVLFEATPRLGGQLNLAKEVPGKSEFNELLRYFTNRLKETGVEVRLGTRAEPAALKQEGFEEVVVAAGIEPRTPPLPGIGHAKVISYTDILGGRRKAGRRVAIIGSGGIGFDVAHMLTHHENGAGEIAAFLEEWSVDSKIEQAGGLAGDPTAPRASPREVVMLQRGTGRPGKGLSMTTGWALKSTLKKHNVENLAGVSYERIDDAGLHIVVDGKPRTLEVDSIVVCAGQEPNRGTVAGLEAAGYKPWLIGGAKEAKELDALRAIEEGLRLALAL